MSIELSREINPMGSRQSGQESSGGMILVCWWMYLGEMKVSESLRALTH
jgi:hypothetical protein